MITVRFVFMTGIKPRLFRNARLCGFGMGRHYRADCVAVYFACMRITSF